MCSLPSRLSQICKATVGASGAYVFSCSMTNGFKNSCSLKKKNPTMPPSSTFLKCNGNHDTKGSYEFIMCAEIPSMTQGPFRRKERTCPRQETRLMINTRLLFLYSKDSLNLTRSIIIQNKTIQNSATLLCIQLCYGRYFS